MTLAQPADNGYREQNPRQPWPRAYTLFDQQWILWFGLGVLLVAYLVDRRTREDYAFWLYIFGTLSFFAGLSLLVSRDIEKLAQMHLYLLAWVAMMLVLALLRHILLVFVAIGLVGYLGFMSWVVFKDSLIFPFLLTVIGLSIIRAGLEYRKHGEMIEASLLDRVPDRAVRWLPSSRTPPVSGRGPSRNR